MASNYKMEWINIVLDFLNNASAAAFIGAASAYLLVVLTDRRREKQKVRTITREVEILKGHAQTKLQRLRACLQDLRVHHFIVPSPVFKFDTTLIRKIAAEVPDRLSLPQRKALDGLCYHMEATDAILVKIFDLAESIADSHGMRDDKALILDQLISIHNASIANHKRILETCDCYLTGDYETILTKRYKWEDYADPNS